MIKLISNFFSYWYFRYLLVTELYMVEKWERAMFHIVFLIFFGILALFNIFVTMGIVSWFSASFVAEMDPNNVLINIKDPNIIS